MAFKLDLDFETWGQESASNRAGVEPLREDLGARTYGVGLGGRGTLSSQGAGIGLTRLKWALQVNSITLEALGSH